MTDATDYKSRSMAVRREARARLMALRAARQSARMAVPGQDASAMAAEAATPEAEAFSPSPAASALAAQAAEDVAAQALDDAADCVDAAEDALAEDAVTEDPSTDDAATEDAAIEDAVADDGPDADADTEADASASDAAPTIVPLDGGDALGPIDAADPLKRLPGMGPGLIWQLEQSGVATIGALVEADRNALERDLGVLGQIIDLSSWVEHARARLPA